MNNYIDTHLHLDLIENIEKTLQYIEQKQIYTIAVTNHPKVFEGLMGKINSKFVRIALGMHPELGDKANMNLFKELVISTKYIGEIGLDFSNKGMAQNKKQKQIKIFEDILLFSKKKLFSIHSRDAENEVLNSINMHFDKTSHYILHWYTGSKTNLLKAIELGCYFSINISMLRTKKFLELLPFIPKDKLLIETDSPFSKGSIFTIEETYKRLAEVLELSLINVKSLVFENFREALTL